MRVVRLAFTMFILVVLVSSWTSPQTALAAGTSTPTQPATSLVVTKLADTNDGVCDSDCSLREAIAVAPWNGVVTFAPGLSGTITLTGEIAFAKSLTIIGPVSRTITLDGNAQGRILYLNIQSGVMQNPLLTLSNLNFTNASDSAVNVTNGSLSMLNCNFVNNRSSTRGGGVYFNSYFGPNVLLSIDRCTFSNNTAQNQSGAIDVDVEYDTNFNMIVRDSRFVGNQAGMGGAMYFYTISPGSLLIERSVFDSNVANGYYPVGGAIKTYGGVFNINDSVFSNNSAIDSGAAIHNWGNLSIAHSLFVGNRVINGNNTGSGGAAIVNYVGNTTVSNSTFTDNSVAGSYVFGTVLHNYGSVVTLINDTITGNTGAAGVSVLSNFTTGGTFILKNTIVANNSLPGCAFFIFTDGGHNIQYPGTSCGTTISSVDPLLGTLADNGGITKTIALLPGSPAIDAGDNAICAASPINNFDQRGYIRPVDGDNNGSAICDIGAFERLSSAPTPTATASPSSTATSTATVTATPTATPTNTATTAPFRPDTIGVYSDGVFYLRNSNSAGPADIVVPFGTAGNLPITGDWDGDGIDTIGVYIVELGVFVLRDSNTPGAPDHAFVMGNPGDEPIAGKWDPSMSHDGIGVYRPSNGLLFGKRNLVNGYADYTMVLGNPGDHGIAGDWDGNGYDSIGVYRPSVTRFYLANQMGGTTTTPAIIFSDYDFAVSPSGLTPIAGDWTGSGVSRVGYVLNGIFSLKNTFNDGSGETAFAFGVPGALPVTGKWTKSSANNVRGTVIPPVRLSPTPESGHFD